MSRVQLGSMSRSGAASDLCGPGVSLETFLPGEPCHVLDQVGIEIRVRSDPGAHTKEVQDGKPTPCSGSAARGKDVVGPHTVIPEHLRRAFADEKGAVVAESVRPSLARIRSQPCSRAIIAPRTSPRKIS